MASGGYPDQFEKGKSITGLSESGKSLIFHAGTLQKDHQIVTNGGRVLAVTGKGKSLMEASENAYATVSQIRWEGVYFRKDISQDLAKVESMLRN